MILRATRGETMAITISRTAVHGALAIGLQKLLAARAGREMHFQRNQ